MTNNTAVEKQNRPHSTPSRTVRESPVAEGGDLAGARPITRKVACAACRRPQISSEELLPKCNAGERKKKTNKTAFYNPQGHGMCFQHTRRIVFMDTGATVNILDHSTFEKLCPRPKLNPQSLTVTICGLLIEVRNFGGWQFEG